MKNIDIDMVIFENIDIDIDKEILENIDIDIDIDKEILENIDIDRILKRLESNSPRWLRGAKNPHQQTGGNVL